MVVGAEPGEAVGVGGMGVRVAVSVGTGVSVIVDVADGIAETVKVGSGVSIPPDGWKGVGVGDALGACVTKIKVGKTGGAGVGAEQEKSKVIKNTQHATRMYMARVACCVLREN
jgi:hypothetical protein